MPSKNTQVSRSRVITPIPNEVPLERVVIDSVLRSMLERVGADLHGIAETLIKYGYYHDPLQSRAKYAWEQVGDDVYDLSQDGLDPPVMSTGVALGNACYHGDYLYVRELLPQTICASAVGRRLGDVVSTGIPELDDRKLIRVLTCEDHWPPIAATRFLFAPDLVELGPRPISLSTGKGPQA